MGVSDFESQREEALYQLDDENVDQFILITHSSDQTKHIYAAKEEAKNSPHHLDLLLDSIKRIFEIHSG